VQNLQAILRGIVLIGFFDSAAFKIRDFWSLVLPLVALFLEITMIRYKEGEGGLTALSVRQYISISNEE